MEFLFYHKAKLAHSFLNYVSCFLILLFLPAESLLSDGKCIFMPRCVKRFTKNTLWWPWCRSNLSWCAQFHSSPVFRPSSPIKSQADTFSFTCSIWHDLGNGLIYLGRFKIEKQAIETDLLVSAIDQLLDWKLIMSRRNVSGTSSPTELLKGRPINTEAGARLPLMERWGRKVPKRTVKFLCCYEQCKVHQSRHRRCTIM